MQPKIVKEIKVNRATNSGIISFEESDIFLSFRFVSNDIINISYYKSALIKNEYVDIFEEEFSESPDIRTSRDDDKYTVSNGYLDINIYKDPFFYEIVKGDSTILKQAIDDKDIIGNRYSELFKFTQIDNNVVSIKDSFSIGQDEKFYGFGEKFSPINKRGQNIEAWNHDAMGVGSDKAYKNIPFFLNSKGYGVLINTTSKINYNLATLSFDSYTIEAEDAAFDYYFIYGPSYKEIISKYIVLTGELKDVPPKWSFGLWMSRYGYRTRDEVEKVAERLRKEDIPADVISLDPFWLKNGHYCDFEFNEDNFPDPEEMISSMKKKGFRFRIWIQPTVSIKSDMFKEGSDGGYFLKDKKGDVYLWQSPLPNEPEGTGPVDFSKIDLDKLGLQPEAAIVEFTNPQATSWYLSKLKYLIDWGVGIIMCDFGEDVPEDAVFYNGRTGREMRNIYSSLYSGAVYNFIKSNRDEKPICHIRSGWIGMQRYPICWAGDPKTTFEAMREVLRGGLSIALSGVMFWSHDIGGTAPVMPEPALYIRWAQFGMFTSHTRCHGMTPNEPWHYGEEALKIFRKYDKLRYSLIPYIYSCANTCVSENTPFIKPLVLEYQDDPIAAGIDDEYIFGDSFLVAPVFDRNDFRYIYFPEGKWIDYWTKKVYEGMRQYRYKAPLDLLPLFVKSGSIIPMQEEGKSHIVDEPMDKLILDIYPDDRSDFKYIDDYDEIDIRCALENEALAVNISDLKKSYKLIINNFSSHGIRKLMVNEKSIDNSLIKISKDNKAIIDLD